jgi:hypothetical protein
VADLWQNDIVEKLKNNDDLWRVSEHINEEPKLNKAKKRKIKNDEIHFLKAQCLADLCIKPRENEQYRIITTKQFNAYAVVLHLLETEIIEEMYLAIYRINEPTVASLIDLIESGSIKKAYFIICSFFHQTKKPQLWAEQLKSYCESKPQCKYSYINSHAKVLAVKTESGGHYVFEGSGNMSDNGRIEQYVYERNQEIYEFHRAWITEITGKL